jgi:hypothetical protein
MEKHRLQRINLPPPLEERQKETLDDGEIVD